MKNCLIKIPSQYASTLFIIASAAMISACASSDDTETTETRPSASVISEAISELSAADAARSDSQLVVDTAGDCSAAGETVSLTLFSRTADVGIPPAADSNQTGNNVTGFASFLLGADSTEANVSIISHSDTQFDFSINRPNIVSINASFASNSSTDFIAAWPADAPESAVLVSELDNGACFYSMRLPGFCGTTRGTNAPSRIATGNTVLEFTGCEITQAPDLPVVRIN